LHMYSNIFLNVWSHDSRPIHKLCNNLAAFHLKVEKYCGVFETLGEKRLASHLLLGVEALLPLLFPNITLEQVSIDHMAVM